MPHKLLFGLLALLISLPAWGAQAEGEEEEPIEGDPFAEEPTPAKPPKKDGPAPAPQGSPMEQITAALRDPAKAASTVREAGPKANSVPAARTILKAAGDHGKSHADLYAACVEALRAMTSQEVIHFLILAKKKEPGLNTGSLRALYEALGGFKIADGARFTVGEKPMNELRREALTEGLRSSTKEHAEACAKSLGESGDKGAVGLLVKEIASATGEKEEALATALRGLTGVNARTAEGWKRWWDKKGQFEFMEGPAVSEDDEEALASYYGMPITSKFISFCIDTSDSMAPDEDPTGLPRAGSGEKDPVQDPANWIEIDRAFTSKVKLAKHELITTLLTLPPEVEFNIVFFCADVTQWPEDGSLMKATAEGKNAAIDRVLAQRCSRGTPLQDGLDKSWANSKVETIFLLTDGRPVGSRLQKIEDIVNECKKKCTGSRKIKINTIDFSRLLGEVDKKGTVGNPLLRYIATATGGTPKVFSGGTMKIKVYKPGGGSKKAVKKPAEAPEGEEGG